MDASSRVVLRQDRHSRAGYGSSMISAPDQVDADERKTKIMIWLLWTMCKVRSDGVQTFYEHYRTLCAAGILDSAIPLDLRMLQLEFTETLPAAAAGWNAPGISRGPSSSTLTTPPSPTKLAAMRWLQRSPLAAPGGASRYLQEFEEFEELGRGGFGCIVRAKSRVDDQFYAVKKIRCRLLVSQSGAPGGLDSYLHERILKEARVIASLNHPNICRYHQAWTEVEWEPVAGSNAAVDVGWGRVRPRDKRRPDQREQQSRGAVPRATLQCGAPNIQRGVGSSTSPPLGLRIYDASDSPTMLRLDVIEDDSTDDNVQSNSAILTRPEVSPVAEGSGGATGAQGRQHYHQQEERESESELSSATSIDSSYSRSFSSADPAGTTVPSFLACSSSTAIIKVGATAGDSQWTGCHQQQQHHEDTEALGCRQQQQRQEEDDRQQEQQQQPETALGLPASAAALPVQSKVAVYIQMELCQPLTLAHRLREDKSSLKSISVRTNSHLVILISVLVKSIACGNWFRYF